MRSASWVVVDALDLVRDGVVVETVEWTEASFRLAPEVDAWYSVIARGSRSMAPVSGSTPWAMTRPMLVDVGWDAPLGQMRILD